MDNTTNQLIGWIKLYHPTGAQITLPLPVQENLTARQASAVFGSVSEYLSAGFLVNAPGLEEGELVEEVNTVARREAKDETPIIDFYASNAKLLKKFMHVYLNVEQDVLVFEEAAGVKLASLPVYEGSLALARDDSKAKKYLVNLPRPIKLIWKLSPKWQEWKASGGEGIEPHKRLLVRYEASLNPAASAASASVRSYLDGTLVNGDLNEQNAFDTFKKTFAKAPASKAALKAWHQANKHLPSGQSNPS